MRRTVCWFSAGAASAVAAKLTLTDTPGAVLAYTDPGSEHEDNLRFIHDCEQWFGKEVNILRSGKYADTWQVFKERRFLNSPRGALCTTEMKKKVREDFQRADDIQVFGFTSQEQARADRFRKQNPEVDLRTPLIDKSLTKKDCLWMVQEAGIKLPAMYLLGYDNNNCIGCVKGGMGYWNKIRRDFPDTFARMALVEREIDATVLRVEGESIFLDELEPERGYYKDEPSFECSLLCALESDGLA